MSILILGEAWGKEEADAGAPFVGASGRLLTSLLSQVGIARSECYLTNVFNLQPQPSNDIKNLCGPKSIAIPGLPALSAGKYVRAEYASELDRLYREIEHVRPNLIIALGGTATWALTRQPGIRKVRGAATLTDPAVSTRIGGPVKILPTYHPAAVLREWTLRPIVLADLHKARREALFPELRRPEREVWIEPTLDDLIEFERRYITRTCQLSIDVETKGNQITCFGVAPSPSHAIVVPFFMSNPIRNYWPSLEEELKAWEWIRHICALPNAKLGQNFQYDLKFLWQSYGIPVINFEDDTMLAHHAQQPEMEKGLAFLGSVYTNEASWKFMRKNETIKTED